MSDEIKEPINQDNQYVEADAPQTSGVMDKILKFLKTTVGLILLFIIVFGLNIAFIALFIININQEVDWEVIGCGSLVRWDKGVYINLIIATAFQSLKFALNFCRKKDEEESSTEKNLGILINLCGLAGLVMFIGVQVVYFKLLPSQCGSLGSITFAYIITIYSILGVLIVLPCLLFLCICLFAVCVNKNQ